MELARTALHYDIAEELGKGGMGIVYKALDRKLNRFVALKFLRPGTATPYAIERFLFEASAISAVNHPNIATIHALEQEGETRFLVLEYLPGGTLRSKLKAEGGKLPPETVIRYITEAAEGLSLAHRRGVVHRDIKPGNLMLTEDDHVKVTDFGVAKLIGASDLTGDVVGTRAYMAPEQAEGEPADARSDVYALGIVMYQLLTGHVPLDDSSTGIAKLSLPAGLPPLLKKATELDADKRFQGMDEFLAALRGVRRALDLGTQTETTTIATARRTLAISIFWVVLAILLAALAAPIVLRSFPAATAWLRGLPEKRMLALLPFRDLGEGKDSAFSDGLMIIVANKLTQLEQFQESLRVVAAADTIREHTASAREAKRTFGANLALSTSVRRSGNAVTVTLDLIGTNDGGVLGSRTIESPEADLQFLPNRLVDAIASLLEVEIAPEARKAIAADWPSVAGAYDAYLQGRGYLQAYQIPGNIDRAVAKFDEAIARDPRFALAYAAKAQAYLNRFNSSKLPVLIQQARADATRALELDKELAPVHVSMGLALSASGRYQEAITSMKRALQIEPASPEAVLGLANVYKAAGMKKEAIAMYEQAIALRPDYWGVYRDAGIFYFNAGDLAQAAEAFKKVIELTPNSPIGHYSLGGVYLAARRPQEAAREMEISLALKPTYGAYSNLGVIRFSQGRYDEAAKYFEKAVELSRTDYIVIGNLADAYRWSAKSQAKAPEAYREAIRHANEILAVNPANARAISAVATYYAALDDRQNALKYAEKALGVGPNDQTVLLRAAIVFEQLGNRNRALNYLDLALKAGASVFDVTMAAELQLLRADSRYEKILKKYPQTR